jgi:hypothetical protein
VSLKTSEGRDLVWATDKTFPVPSTPLAQQIAAAWQLVYLRPIAPEEFAAVAPFLHQQFNTLSAANPTVDPAPQALTNLCQILLSSNEFLYVD